MFELMIELLSTLPSSATSAAILYCEATEELEALTSPEKKLRPPEKSEVWVILAPASVEPLLKLVISA